MESNSRRKERKRRNSRYAFQYRGTLRRGNRQLKGQPGKRLTKKMIITGSTRIMVLYRAGPNSRGAKVCCLKRSLKVGKNGKGKPDSLVAELDEGKVGGKTDPQSCRQFRDSTSGDFFEEAEVSAFRQSPSAASQGSWFLLTECPNGCEA